MAKLPRPGRVKTRMCPPLSFEQAAELAEAFLRDVLVVVDRAREKLELEVVLSIALGDGERIEDAAGLLDAQKFFDPVRMIRSVAQSPGHLGARILEAHRAPGADETVVIGSDAPHMDPARLVQAFEALEVADVVFGPVLDGGYDLIGARRLPEALASEAIPWSTSGVLDASRRAAAQAGMRALELAMGSDVDELSDLVRVLLDAPKAALRHTRPVARRVLG